MSRDALDAARTRLDAVLAEGSGGWDQFTRLASAKSEWDTQMYLNHACYGEAFQCISCGCSVGVPCVSHRGNPRHMAELAEAQLAALKEIAAK